MKKYLEFINESYGSGVFASFCKCLTALGFKENSHSKNIPNEFLIFYKLDHTDSLKVKSVFSRFKSLQSVDFGNESKCSLYFGIKRNNTFEYGIFVHDLSPIGSFKISNSKLNSLKLSQLKSLTSLKKDIVDLTSADVILMNKIKTDLIKFNELEFKKREFAAPKDKIISVGFYGIGRWDNGNIDDGSLSEIKDKFKEYISKFSWSKKVLMSVKCSSFWTNLSIKIK